MCGGGSSPAPPEKLPEAPRFAASPSQSAGASVRRMISQARGATRGGTLLTGPRGVGGPALENPTIPLASATSLLTGETNEQKAANKRKTIPSMFGGKGNNIEGGGEGGG